MKKFILVMMMAIFTAIGANAQVAYEKAKILDNTYVGVQGGVTTPISKTLTPFNGTAGVKVGKNWTPLFGTNIEGNFWFGDTRYMNGKTSLKSHYVGVNHTLNLTNLICGYNPQKVFESNIELGIGWAHYYNHIAPNGQEGDLNDIAAKTGFTFAWNLGKAKAWQIYANPTIYWNLTRNDKPQFNRHDAQMGVNVGVIYKFKTSNKTHNFKVYNISEYTETIATLKETNEALLAENRDLKNRPTVVQEVVKEVKETVFTDNTVSVSFIQNSAVLTQDAKNVLDKVSPTTKVKVYGATSPEGTEARNTVLAVERANAVANYLKERGVQVVSADGGENGRIAVVTVVK